MNTGCLNHCSYCKTKHARGSLRSYPPEEIVQRARQALSGACLGVHVCVSVCVCVCVCGGVFVVLCVQCVVSSKDVGQELDQQC